MPVYLKCPVCGKMFAKHYGRQVTCSPECSKINRTKSQKEASRRYTEKTYTRVGLNLRNDDHAVVDQARSLTGEPMATFIKNAIMERAARIIAEHDTPTK